MVFKLTAKIPAEFGSMAFSSWDSGLRSHDAFLGASSQQYPGSCPKLCPMVPKHL